MAKFWVSCTFEVYTVMLVEADSAEQAESKAEDVFDPSDYSAELYFDADKIDDESTLPKEELSKLL